jgi:hypothetical protein
MYHERWEEELVFDEQKTHQDPRRPGKPAQLRSQTPEGVEQELYALSIGHFVVRALMLEAAKEEQLDVDRLSFTGCLRILQARLPECDSSTSMNLENWYHLLLDGTAFLTLYSSLLDASILRRLLYVCAAAVGSLLLSWAAAPSVATNGLCGLSGIAHGLMAVSALEMVAGNPAGSAERRVGLISFILVISKSAFEALTGRMFFAFLDFGLLGDPVAVSHAGGIIGSLLAMLLLGFWHHKKRAYLNR